MHEALHMCTCFIIVTVYNFVGPSLPLIVCLTGRTYGPSYMHAMHADMRMPRYTVM